MSLLGASTCLRNYRTYHMHIWTVSGPCIQINLHCNYTCTCMCMHMHVHAHEPTSVLCVCVVLQSMQAELDQQNTKRDSVAALGQSLMTKCSPEDAAFVKDNLSELNSRLDGVQRGVDVMKRMAEDGLVSALAFLAAWNDAMAAIADKKAELESLGDVGGDIDTVKAQLEEYKVLYRLQTSMHVHKQLFYTLNLYTYCILSMDFYASVPMRSIR